MLPDSLSQFVRREDGQTYSLQAVIGSMMILTALAFTLQAVAVTPLTASMSNEEVATQNEMLAEDTLDIAIEQETLTKTLRYYDTTDQKFVGASDDGWYRSSPPTKFGTLLDSAFGSNAAYNIYISHQTPDNGDTVRNRLVYQGTPSSASVSASRTVLLYDGMPITDPENDATIAEDGNFYIEDASDGNLYNVVTVEIVVWGDIDPSATWDGELIESIPNTANTQNAEHRSAYYVPSGSNTVGNSLNEITLDYDTGSVDLSNVEKQDVEKVGFDTDGDGKIDTNVRDDLTGTTISNSGHKIKMGFSGNYNTPDDVTLIVKFDDVDNGNAGSHDVVIGINGDVTKTGTLILK